RPAVEGAPGGHGRRCLGPARRLAPRQVRARQAGQRRAALAHAVRPVVDPDGAAGAGFRELAPQAAGALDRDLRPVRPDGGDRLRADDLDRSHTNLLFREGDGRRLLGDPARRLQLRAAARHRRQPDPADDRSVALRCARARGLAGISRAAALAHPPARRPDAADALSRADAALHLLPDRHHHRLVRRRHPPERHVLPPDLHRRPLPRLPDLELRHPEHRADGLEDHDRAAQGERGAARADHAGALVRPPAGLRRQAGLCAHDQVVQPNQTDPAGDSAVVHADPVGDRHGDYRGRDQALRRRRGRFRRGRRRALGDPYPVLEQPGRLVRLPGAGDGRSVSRDDLYLPARPAGRTAAGLLYPQVVGRLPPHSYGEVAPSYGVGGVMSRGNVVLPDPSVADYRATSPYEWGGKSIRSGEMDIKGEYRIEAPREKVFAALNDAEVLKACIPGCESLDKLSDTEMTAKVRLRIGPVSAAFSGKVTLSDIDPPNGYKISGEGQGGVAGFAKGGAAVKLTEDTGATVLAYDVDAQVGGKIAQVGARLIQGTARKLADQFFGKFAESVGAPPPAVSA